VVIPHWTKGGRVFTADGAVVDGHDGVSTFDGIDPGWAIIGYRSGISRFTERASTREAVFTGFAASAGHLAPSVGNDALEGIVMGADRSPYFAAAPPPLGPPGPDLPLPLADEQRHLVRLEVGAERLTAEQIAAAPAHVRYNALLAGVDPHGTLRTQAGNAGDLALSVAQGWAGATSLDDQRLRAWQVVFEENVDGRRRARIDTFQLQPSDPVAIAPWHVYLDDSGDMVQSSISYYYPPSTEPPAQPLTSFDPTFVTKVPLNAFPE
jgi:hypothetical protein